MQNLTENFGETLYSWGVLTLETEQSSLPIRKDTHCNLGIHFFLMDWQTGLRINFITKNS